MHKRQKKPRPARNSMQEKEHAQERRKALTCKKEEKSMTEEGKGSRRVGEVCVHKKEKKEKRRITETGCKRKSVQV